MLVLSAGTLCPGLAGGLYRVPLGPCSRGNHFAARKKGENRRKQKEGGPLVENPQMVSRGKVIAVIQRAAFLLDHFVLPIV